MGRLIPEGLLTIRQAADELSVAMYSGMPDRTSVKKHRESGFDVADGAAIEDAVSEIWAAVDSGKLQALLVGPRRRRPLKLPAVMSQEIPALRSPRGGDFNFLRPRNPHYGQFVEWFGPDLTKVSVVFREVEIRRLARTLLRTRRRRAAPTGAKRAGRPSRQVEVERIIEEVINARKWVSTQSIKALTRAANSRGKWLNPLSDDTVSRALDNLYGRTGDRRFERLRREKQMPTAAHP